MRRGTDARCHTPPRRRGSRGLAVALFVLAVARSAGGATEDPEVAPPRVLARGHLDGDGTGGQGWVGDIAGQHVVHFIEVGLFLTSPLTGNRFHIYTHSLSRLSLEKNCPWPPSTRRRTYLTQGYLTGRIKRWQTCTLPWIRSATLEGTQGQINGFCCQLSYKCHQNRVSSVGD